MSKGYNYVFNKETGFFARWGETKKDDPQFSPIGPEILDIEVTTKCTGPGGKLCAFCYKANTPNGDNMSLATFKGILNKMLPSSGRGSSQKQAGVTQVAFGADATCLSNPDLFKMMDHCRDNDVVPNITVADITDETADELIKRVGAVAVSRYADENICYDSVKRLTDRGLVQTNIHVMISEETYNNAMSTLRHRTSDSRLSKLNAIVFLSLKQKGRGTGFTPLSQAKFNKLIKYAFDHKIAIGFDSCSAHKFETAIKGRLNEDQLKQMIEPCESSCFSSYIDVFGDFYPCSFATDFDYIKPLSVIKANDFIDDIWNHSQTKEFREKLIDCGRDCPLYKI